MKKVALLSLPLTVILGVVSAIVPVVTQASTLFTDPFTGTGELHNYNNAYIKQFNTIPNADMAVFTDHVALDDTSPGDNAEYVYTGIPAADNQCESLEFIQDMNIFDGNSGVELYQNTANGDISTEINLLEIGAGSFWSFIPLASDGSKQFTGSISYDPATRHTVKECVNGSTVTAYLDGTRLFSMTGSPIASGDYFGFLAQVPQNLDNFTIEDAPPLTQLTSLSDAQVYVSRKLPTIHLDLKAEVYKGTTLVSSGQLNSVAPGLRATLESIPFSTFSPVALPAGSDLKLVVSVRNACSGSILNFGNATLYYNNTPVDSRFGATVDRVTSTYHLRNLFALSTTAGTSQQTSVVAAGVQCSAFKPFGTWSITL
jgi:hypothetical protein